MPRAEFLATVTDVLDEIQQGLYDRALAFREEHTRVIDVADEFREETGGHGRPASASAGVLEIGNVALHGATVLGQERQGPGPFARLCARGLEFPPGRGIGETRRGKHPVVGLEPFGQWSSHLPGGTGHENPLAFEHGAPLIPTERSTLEHIHCRGSRLSRSGAGESERSRSSS